MITTNNTIPQSMLDSLQRCKGLMLDSVLCTDTGNPVKLISMQVVVLCFKDFDIELWNEEQPDIPGELNDLAKIRIRINSEKNLQSPIGQRNEDGKFISLDFIQIEVKKRIHGIRIHNEKVKRFNAAGIEQFEFDNTRAIVISLGDVYLHIEKKSHWSEIWDVAIKETGFLEQTSEWENEEDVFYEVHPYSCDL